MNHDQWMEEATRLLDEYRAVVDWLVPDGSRIEKARTTLLAHLALRPGGTASEAAPAPAQSPVTRVGEHNGGDYDMCRPAFAPVLAESLPSAELTWLYTHCRAIGMTKKSDSGKWEEDIALFTTDQSALLRECEQSLDMARASIPQAGNDYDRRAIRNAERVLARLRKALTPEGMK